MFGRLVNWEIGKLVKESGMVYIILALAMACFWSGMAMVGVLAGVYPGWVVLGTFVISFLGCLWSICICASGARRMNGR